MRSRILFAAAAALSLCACGATTSTAPPASAGGIPAGSYELPAAIDTAATVADAVAVPAPVTYADRTTLDETAAIGFETAVRAAADLATLAVRTRIVPTARLPELREKVALARTAVGAVRAAYDTGNAASYRAATANARTAIDAVRTLANGEGR